MLIRDTFSFGNIQVISENTSTGPMRVRGIFQRHSEPNNNKRRYPKPVLEREVNKLLSLVNERKLCGELDHPEGPTVRLSNVSHLITKLGWKGKELIGEAEVLNTPSGKVLQELFKSGIQVGISSRGTGSLSESIDGFQDVNEDYNMITFDFVSDPSTYGAYPQMSESKMVNEVVEIKDRARRKAIGERLFVNLLKKEIKEAVMKTNKGREGPMTGYTNLYKKGEYELVKQIGANAQDDVKRAVQFHQGQDTIGREYPPEMGAESERKKQKRKIKYKATSEAVKLINKLEKLISEATAQMQPEEEESEDEQKPLYKDAFLRLGQDRAHKRKPSGRIKRGIQIAKAVHRTAINNMRIQKNKEELAQEKEKLASPKKEVIQPQKKVAPKVEPKAKPSLVSRLKRRLAVKASTAKHKIQVGNWKKKIQQKQEAPEQKAEPKKVVNKPKFGSVKVGVSHVPMKDVEMKSFSKRFEKKVFGQKPTRTRSVGALRNQEIRRKRAAGTLKPGEKGIKPSVIAAAKQAAEKRRAAKEVAKNKPKMSVKFGAGLSEQTLLRFAQMMMERGLKKKVALKTAATDPELRTEFKKRLISINRKKASSANKLERHKIAKRIQAARHIS